jgi:hypothetical protein
MKGMLIARIHLLFSCTNDKTVDDPETPQCALVSWFLPSSEEKDVETGMWAVKPEGTPWHQPLQAKALHEALIYSRSMVSVRYPTTSIITMHLIYSKNIL